MKDSDASNAHIKELHLRIDPGESTPEEIAEVLDALSEFYESLGGPGIVFKVV